MTPPSFLFFLTAPKIIFSTYIFICYEYYLLFFLLYQDLENNIRNHSDERLEKIQEIGGELVEHNIMTESISDEVQRITERWNQLQHQVLCKLDKDYGFICILIVHDPFCMFRSLMTIKKTLFLSLSLLPHKTQHITTCTSLNVHKINKQYTCTRLPSLRLVHSFAGEKARTNA